MYVSTNLGSSDYWREYNAADFGKAIDLGYKGSLPKLIVLKEAGALYCTRRNGDDTLADATLTGLPAGYMHTGRVATILPAQTAGIVVYW